MISNKMLLKPLLAGFFLMFFSTQLMGQNVRTSVSTDSVSVGDVIYFSIVLQLDDEYDEIIYPDTALFPPALEFSGRQQFRLSSFSDSTAFRLQFFGNQHATISILPVTLISGNDSTVLYTDPVTLFFKPLVEEGDTSIKPMKPIFGFPRTWWPWILAAILMMAFLIWWFKFREKPEPIQEAPKPVYIPFQNPLEKLEISLHSIRQSQNLAETRDFKTFYSSISDALRTYYEDLYLIPALESTSRELLRYLDAYGVDQEMVDITRRMLNKADLVKFAKFTPTLEDAHSTYQHAIDFLDRARIADASRISRKKSDYENKMMIQENQEEIN